jgi:uncharacterized protein (TIGR03437 family)
MRYLSTKPAMLIIVVLSAGLYLQRTKITAGAELAQPPFTGEATATQLIDPPLAELARLTAGDGAAEDRFGRSVAVSGDTLVVGADQDDIEANGSQGSAYVFIRSGGVWSFQQKLTANDGASSDAFGSSIAISGDTVVIGAPFDDSGTNVNQGSAYVFVRSGTGWTQQQKLTASDGEATDRFGNSVAVSGDTVFVGASFDVIGANPSQGSVHVFVRSGTVWSFQQKLTADDGEKFDFFGISIAVSGDTVVVGAAIDNIGANIEQGSAYVFARSGAIWSFQQKLTADDGAADNHFGNAVAISGDTMIIGAVRNDVNGNTNQRAAYIFVRSGTVWLNQQKLMADDGAEGDLFGISVALHGNTALIGAHGDDIGAVENQGSAYLFSRSGAIWTQRQKLTARDGAADDFFGQAVALGRDIAIAGAIGTDIGVNMNQGALYLFGCSYVEQQTLTGAGGAASDNFGAAVSIDGDTAVVGAPFDDVGTASDQGSAFVFVRNGTAWTQAAQVFANDGAAGDQFGHSVAISGDYIVIGAHGKNINGNLDQGAAYVFVRSGGTWTQQARLLADDGADEEFFGFSVSLSGARVAVGASQDNIGGKQNQGSVYLFARSGSTWPQEIKLTANDGAVDNYFGRSVALAGDLLIAGAPHADIDTNRDQGAAYVFESSVTPWRQRAKLTAGDGAAGGQFGSSVALFGLTTLVGAPNKRFGSNLSQGAAYVIVGPSTAVGSWSQQARLMLGDGAAGDQLGYSVALSGNTAVVGAATKTISGRTRQGAAFVFTSDGSLWSLRQPIVADDGTIAALYGSSVAVSGDTIVVGASFMDTNGPGAAYVLKNKCGPPLTAFTSLSAASFAPGGMLATESITAGFGANLATDTLAAPSLPLPTTLAGVSLKVTDSVSVERLAPLFFVSPGQINYQIPPGTATGPVSVTVTNSACPVASGAMTIANVAPGLFSANANGQGVAAALVLRIKADRSQSYEPIAQFDAAQNRFVPAPIDLGPDTDQVFLVLFGTGLRFRSSLTAVSCTIGGTGSELLFAGAVPEFVGLDQVNVRLPRSLAGRGEVDVVLVVDSKAANTVRVSIL